ncbi:hypothetical protein WMY93_013130 [Mugilogobius chulae]|uniref:Uncharacterized protein n=1 Tax=Mugilogobius chulae TaxID=88201 RepID=A0AAW0P2K4_9GOBI
MAETVRVLCERRALTETDAGKTAVSLRGRGYGRKRKGTPVKVFLPDSGEAAGQGKGAAERVATVDRNKNLPPKLHKGSKSSSCSNPDTPPALPSPATGSAQTSSHTSTSSKRTAPTASAPRHSSPPAPNCRIREVHCGNQVRLVGFRGGLSPAQFECTETENNTIKKENELLPLTTSPQEQQHVYVTPSWSLSPSASPISHSDGSGSEREEDCPSPRDRAPVLRKKHRSTPSKKKTPHRTSSGRAQQTSVSSDPHNQSVASPEPPSSSSTKSCSKFQLPSVPQTLSPKLASSVDGIFVPWPDVCSALVERYTQTPRLSQTQNSHTNNRLPAQMKSSEEFEAQDLSLSSSSLTAAHHSSPGSPSPSGASVLKHCPPARKGGKKRSMAGIRNEEEDLAEPDLKRAKDENVRMLKLKEDDTFNIDEENAMREEDFDSGTEDKEKASSSSGRSHMLPLLSSLSSLVLYLRRLQHSAFLSLTRQLQSSEAWRLLCHSSLSLLILYNRRRECEVSKLSISEYHTRVTPQCPVPVPPGAPPALTPLEASLSPFERQVLTHLPRVGVQGKRGRIQPLILPPHSEPCLQLLLQTRHGVGVDPANPYMFARPYHSPATPLRGTELLRSLARSSGIRNPRTLTQTRVRRQVGILTQLLFLGEEAGQVGASAVERLEHFLEREYHVIQSCADISQDAGLMGRVGRVVLCGERDGVLFRGMSLNHICLELDVMSENSVDSYSEGESDGETVREKTEPSPSACSQTQASVLLNEKKTKNNGRSKRPKNTQPLLSPFPSLVSSQPTSRRGTGKRGVLKRPWSEAERAAVEEHLNQNINELRVPAKADCERCLQNSPLLVNNHRDWRAVKFYCHNRIQLLKKIQRRESQPLPVC